MYTAFSIACTALQGTLAKLSAGHVWGIANVKVSNVLPV